MYMKEYCETAPKVVSMEAVAINQWAKIYVGEIENRFRGSRPLQIERGGGSKLRVITTPLDSDEKITISGTTPKQLEERLVVYGKFTDSQAREIIRKVLFRNS